MHPLEPALEYQSMEVIRDAQWVKLKEILRYLSDNSPFYQKRFAEEEIDVDQINSWEGFAQIPLTTKDDLNAHNDDFVCVPPKKIVDYVTSSGTLGDPITFVLTDSDLERLAYNEALSFITAGCDDEDDIQLMTTIDKRFMAGMAYFLGARKLGAGIVRVGSGVPELHWDTIHRIKPSTIIAVPSFILKLIEFAESRGIDYRESGIKRAICIGEALRNEDFSLNTLGQKINEKWPIDLYSTYASTEMSTAFTECSAGQGGHHHPELIVTEFLDDQGNPVQPGEPGEVVITTLGVEGMPLLRFRTGDICRHYTDPCSCGRNTLRLGPVIGRKKQMIKLKGTSVYPPAIYDILNRMEGITNYVVEAYTNEIGTDELLIHIGSKEHSDFFEHQIKERLKAKIRVTPKIAFLPIDKVQQMQFPELSRKPILFLDNRS
ncbi:AMP-binding protein [bacterium SCSIO 12741]|nr:AMP-binding protein [bacterium SCSIO 12741]